MRCEICGNFGTRNGQYCKCAYGKSLRVRNGDYTPNPRIERIVQETIKRNEEALRRLAKV